MGSDATQVELLVQGLIAFGGTTLVYALATVCRRSWRRARAHDDALAALHARTTRQLDTRRRTPR